MAAHDWDLLRDLIGARLEGIARAFHEQGGEVDESTGALELVFEGGRVLHLTTATNGESVRVAGGPWVDPIADPEAEIDAAWAREHGRRVRVDVSARPGYAGAVGARLSLTRWLGNEHQSVAGVEMHFYDAVLTFVSWGDDDHVLIGGADAVPAGWGVLPLWSPRAMTMEA
ncbi:MAG: hypothetical protein ACJ8GN_11685 [Longimicrobiaceae bacterium]